MNGPVSDGGPLIEVEHLTMRFGGLLAVDDVSFSGRPHQITASDNDSEVRCVDQAVDQPAAKGAGAAHHQYGRRHGSNPRRASTGQPPGLPERRSEAPTLLGA